MLHLRTAVAAARRQDRAGADELLGQAERSAVRLGEDGNYWQTGFGPTNVELHRLSAGLDLGDMSWVAKRGEDVDVAHLPVERQVTHMIDLARALSFLARDDNAVDLLLDAERTAPALVRHSAVVRERSPHPPVDCYVVAPASANTVAKLALGIEDNQALTTVGEAIGNAATPVVLFPRVNAAHARHPAWEGHLAALRAGGVHLVYGPDVWVLHEPRQAPPDRQLPWHTVLATVERIISSS